MRANLPQLWMRISILKQLALTLYSLHELLRVFIEIQRLWARPPSRRACVEAARSLCCNGVVLQNKTENKYSILNKQVTDIWNVEKSLKMIRDTDLNFFNAYRSFIKSHLAFPLAPVEVFIHLLQADNGGKNWLLVSSVSSLA